MDSVVTQVARSVSMGQLPSARIDARRKATPRWATGCAASPRPARLMVTKLVRGVASRKPPFSGCKPVSTRSVRARVADRRGFIRPERWWMTCPMAIRAGKA
jgi:hypothetical protein